MRFADHTVIVTGASRGLGRATALAFAAEGAHVYLGYQAHEREAAATLAALEAAGGHGALLAFDVADSAAAAAAFQRAGDERGRLDVLVNNAGVVRDQALPLMTDEDFDHVVSVSLRGSFVCARAAARLMMARKSGAIVNVASVAGLRASPGQASYSAAKGGVIAMTRTLAAELAPRGIRVNAVVPGLLWTGMTTRMDHRRRDERIAQIPMQRMGTAEEVARVIVFLASADASYIAGQALAVDGGLSA